METLWTIDELATFLNRPKSWVYDNWRPLRIPAFKVGNELRFKPREVASWLEEQCTV